jgi:hypothetical protein
MQNHEHFEELCALAAVGQLPAAEREELELHINDCSLCRETLGDMAFVTDTWIPVSAPLANGLRSLSLKSTKGLRESFLARARDRGLNLTRQSDSHTFWTQWPLHVIRPYTVPVIVAGCAMSVAVVLFVADQRATRLRNESQLLRVQITGLEQDVASLRGKNAAHEKRILNEQSLHLSSTNELAKLRDELDATASRAAVLDAKTQELAKSRDSAEQQLSNARRELAQVSQNYAAASRDLASVRVELDRAHAVDAEDRALLLVQQKKIEELAQRPVVENASLDRDRQLLAADSDIRELMGARNLHIIDVHDRDSKGKARRSFGRVFYTEGKSLIFYAFDLAEPKLKNASFQAWGNKEDGSRKAVSLGVFYMDDKDQSRWVLRFNDPAVLSEIDSVFVTIAPPGGGKQPSGEKQLYAFLNFDANHP